MDYQCVMLRSVCGVSSTRITETIYVAKTLNSQEYTIHVLASFLKTCRITREYTLSNPVKCLKDVQFLNYF